MGEITIEQRKQKLRAEYKIFILQNQWSGKSLDVLNDEFYEIHKEEIDELFK